MKQILTIRLKEEELMNHPKLCAKKLYSLIDKSHKHLDCEGCSGFDNNCVKYRPQIEDWRGDYV